MIITSNQILNIFSPTGRVVFDNRTLTDSFFLYPSYDQTNIQLTRFTFLGEVQLGFQDVKFVELNFTDSVFENTLKISIRGEGLVMINLSNCRFNAGLTIESKNINTVVIANNCKANGEIQLGNSSFSKLLFNEFQFNELSARNIFDFDSSTVANEFSSNKAYLGKCIFSDSTFNCNANFDYAKFDDGTFYNTSFGGDAYFNGAEFGKHFFCNGSTFFKKLILVQCNLKSSDCISDFSGAKFQDEVYFNFSKFKSITFKNCSFDYVASFKDSESIAS